MDAKAIAKKALDIAQAAYDADRGLTADEFQTVRDATQAEHTPPAIRGALKELGAALERQADSRRERARVSAEQEHGRQVQSKLDDRQKKWEALDPLLAAAFHALAEVPHDPALQALAKHLRRPNRGKAPVTFMPECLSEYQRLGLQPLP